MKDITIVTAFFDIGRGGWTPDKGLPHYLERSVDTYIERYAQMAKLDNEIVVISTQDIIDKLKVHRDTKQDKTKYIAFDLSQFNDMREKIIKVQQNPEFQKQVHPHQRLNPEYWNPDYVLVTNLKAYFTNLAIKQNLVTNDMVAWIDFGYCRDSSKIPASKIWQYNFDETKIHMFNYKPYDGKPIERVICENDVYILGAKVVAHKNLWTDMENLMASSFNKFQDMGLIDDDQGLWLQSYLDKPELFDLHTIPDHQKGHDPFVLFNKFNDTVTQQSDDIIIFRTT